MSDSKIYMFPETASNNNGLMGILASLLQLRNIDPNILLTMNRNNGFGGEGGWFIWVIFLFFLMGWGGNGWGGFGNNGSQTSADLAGLINNDNGRELLMSAIQGNGNAINQLASTLNCSVNAIQTAINNVMSQVQNVGSQVGMTGQQVINAIQAGDCQLGNQLAQCCCTIQDSITRQGYENQIAISNLTNAIQNSINNLANNQERNFCNIAYETQRLTCDIQNSIKDVTAQILDGLRAAEMREMQNKIDALRESNSHKDVVINNGQQTAVFGQMIQSATAPIVAAVNNLQGDVNGIKCKLPETVSVQWPNLTAVQTTPIVGYNAWYGLNNCGCNNSLWG